MRIAYMWIDQMPTWFNLCRYMGPLVQYLNKTMVRTLGCHLGILDNIPEF